MEDWQTIIVALVGGGVITFIVTWLFFRRSAKHLQSAWYERRKRARDEVLDILESHFINEDEVSEQLIVQLVRALGRAHEVDIDADCNAVTLLEDVQLRFERSAHLDADEVAEYVEQVQRKIEGIEASSRTLPKLDYYALIEKLEAVLEVGQRERVLEVLTELAEEQRQREIVESERRRELSQRRQLQLQLAISLLVGTLAALTALLMTLLS